MGRSLLEPFGMGLANASRTPAVSTVTGTEMVMNNEAQWVSRDFTGASEGQYLASESRAELNSALAHPSSSKLRSGPVNIKLVGSDCQSAIASISFKDSVKPVTLEPSRVVRIPPPWSPQDIRFRNSPVARPNLDRTYIKPKKIYQTYQEEYDNESIYDIPNDNPRTIWEYPEGLQGPIYDQPRKNIGNHHHCDQWGEGEGFHPRNSPSQRGRGSYKARGDHRGYFNGGRGLGEHDNHSSDHHDETYYSTYHPGKATRDSDRSSGRLPKKTS